MMAFNLEYKWRALCLGVVLALALMSGCGSEGDITAPRLTVNLPDSTTNQSPLTLSGTVEEGATIQLSVTPLPATVGPVVTDGEVWTCTLTFSDSPGTQYSGSVSAADQRGNRSTSLFSFVFDNVAEITFDQFVSPVPEGSEQVLAGTIEPGSALVVEVDGVPIATENILVNVNTWRTNLPGSLDGLRKVVLKSTDRLGNTVEDVRDILVTNTAIPLTITASSPTRLAEQTVMVATDDVPAKIEVLLERGSAEAEEVPPVGGTQTYALLNLVQGKNVLTVTATAADRADTVARVMLVVDQLEPFVSAVVPSATSVEITFSEAVQGVDAETFILRAAEGTVPGQVSYDQNTKVARFVPASDLVYGDYHVELLAGYIADLAGNLILPNSKDLWRASFTLKAPSNPENP
jgi:hypothetical protein